MLSFVKCIADLELKNIIDKLANFVARNGPEFEQMTKQKQKDNPKFSFLFCGEYYNYYQYRVTTEQAGKLCVIKHMCIDGTGRLAFHHYTLCPEKK